MKSVAINIGANSTTPGGRGPIYADGSFRYVPIPETDDTVTEPTYAALGLSDVRPTGVHGTVAHFDPEFPEVGWGQHYTYGDRHAPKTTQIAELQAGDVLFFYATLDFVDDGAPIYEWINEEWGAYLIGHFVLEFDAVFKEAVKSTPPSVRNRLETNAHFRRDEFDAEFLVLGDPQRSRLYDTAFPLSDAAGTEANRVVTDLSADSGSGPWYRRPLRFDQEGTETVLQGHMDGDYVRFT